MNPDVCQKEIGVTLPAHSGIQCSLANGHCMFSDVHTAIQLICKKDAYCTQCTVKTSHWIRKKYSK